MDSDQLITHITTDLQLEVNINVFIFLGPTVPLGRKKHFLVTRITYMFASARARSLVLVLNLETEER